MLLYAMGTLTPLRMQAEARVFGPGGRTFDSSVEWFLHWYPLDFSEVHVFEAEPGLFVLPELSGWTFPVSLSLCLSLCLSLWVRPTGPL